MVVGMQRKSGLRTALAPVGAVWCGRRGQRRGREREARRSSADALGVDVAESAVVGLQFGVAQGQDLDLDLVGIDRRGGLEVSYLLGVPPPLLLAGLVQFPRSLAKFVGPRTGCLVGGQERLTTAATGER
jgi:hypothetical protein